MAISHCANGGNQVTADVARIERRRLQFLYAWLVFGFFALTLGLAVSTPAIAHADSGSSSSDRGSHSARGSSGSSTKDPSDPGSAVATVPARGGVVPKAATVTVPVVTGSSSTAAPSAPAASTPAAKPAQASNPKPSVSDLLKNLKVSTSTATVPVAPAPVTTAAPKTFNFGLGNVGSFNFGSGNKGDWNFGTGNLGSNNVGSGNNGSKNFGIGNTGNGNFGGGNTGSGNIGFGNTGTGNIGIGLTGNNKIGFGGFNSGTGNSGLFNSGSGNKGWFNSGSGNTGLGNSGDTNTGRFNVGDVNSGNANVGSVNTGSFNVGGSNSGSFNPGSKNSGSFNTGSVNTGAFNSGNSNTGFFNSGYLNTGIGNSGNASNGFFETADNQNWFPGLHLEYTVPGQTIDRTVSVAVNQQIPVGPFTLTVGPTTVDAHLTGSIGEIKLTILDIPAGPGFFNTGTVASSGFFNTGAGGGSGLLNTGKGLVSGFFNESLRADEGLSGYANAGTGSGFSNLGSEVSGSRNTSSLPDPAALAFVSGSANIGTLLSGAYFNQVTGTTTFNFGSGNTGYGNAGKGNKGNNNLGSGNAGDGNVGLGNIGSGNLGSGNNGDKNLGGGNVGSGNVGSGNFGSNNFGIGNNGSNNFGAGNTGSGNIGFGNTGTGNIGIGLTGNNQIGFGGFNSGTGNKGLFNSGTGNTGFFNSGTKNWGTGNSGDLNTGFFNSGDVNSGIGNGGNFNTGGHNSGSTNTGSGNSGNTNSGVANVGDGNTGWANTGSANTGWVNTGDLNTGGYNTGNGNNGLFWRRNGGGQLHIDLGADLSQIPITLNADIPVNIPITARLTNPIDIPAVTLPANPLDVSITTQVPVAAGINADVVLNVGGALGPITFPGTSISVPQVVGTLGGPGVSIPLTLNGTVGPGRISFFRLDGPGLFNSTGIPSSGLFNSGGGGGSGFFNSGAAAVSGLLNEALQPGLSGYRNKGSGSGTNNLGSAISGWTNTSSLKDPALPAFISGLRNVGTNLSGIFVNAGAAGGLRPPQATGGWKIGINTNVDVSNIPIDFDGSIGVNLPITASGTGPITLKGFSIPTIPGNINGTATLSVPNLFGPVVIPLVSDLGIGAINVPDINITSSGPLLAGQIGDADTAIPIKISGAIDPNSTPGGGGAALITIKRTTEPGVSVDLVANVPQTPFRLNADVPVDIPFGLSFGDLTLQGVTIPGFNVATSNWQVSHNLQTTSVTGPLFVNFEVPGTTLPVSDITLNPVTVQLPALTGNIGGPGGGVALNLDGGVGPFTIDAPIGVTVNPSPSINLDKVFISQIPFFANLGIDVNLPVTLNATPLNVSQINIPQISIGTNPQGNTLQGLVIQSSIASIQTPPVASTNIFSAQYPCSLLGVCVALGLSPVVTAGPISVGPIQLGFPNDQVLSLNIGGPIQNVTAGVTGSVGPIVASLADQVIEQFPYSYTGNAALDLPISGTTGELDLDKVDVSAPLLALLYQRTGSCVARLCTGMTINPQFVNYLNGGSPAGSALGPFPPNIPATSSALIDTNLGNPIGPLTVLPGMTISQNYKDDVPFGGSGTIGPIKISSAP